MNERSEHAPFEMLSDLVDGRLEEDEADNVRRHLARCPTCSSEHDKLLALLASVRDLPSSVLPADDLWPELRRSLNSRKDVVLPTSHFGEPVARRSTVHESMSWRLRAMLAVAAVVLMAISSFATAFVLRNRTTQLGNTRQPALGATTVLPASFAQAEAEYQRTIDELKLAVDTQRGQLNAETIRTVDRSLAVVDSAIAEARGALMADPNNRILIDLLSSSYERKLELLRRASELGSRT
jgi:hypothetical protein